MLTNLILIPIFFISTETTQEVTIPFLTARASPLFIITTLSMSTGTKTLTTTSPNLWDNGSEGNYWNDYQGADANNDGIGDLHHLIDANNQDRYPLTKPIDLSTELQPQI